MEEGSMLPARLAVTREPAPDGDTLPIPLALVGPGLVFQWANSALAGALGTTPAAIIGRTWYEFCPSAEGRRELHVAWFEGGDVPHRLDEIELPSTGAAPRYATVTVRPLPDASGRVHRLLVIASDATQRVSVRRASEEELAASRRQLEVALAGAQVGIWSLDFRTRRIVLDENSARLVELGPREIGVDDWERAVHVADRDAVRRWFDALAADGDAWHEVEYRQFVRPGEKRWLMLRGRGGLGPDGSVARGVVIDVAARKAAEDELRRSEFRYRLVARLLSGYVYEARVEPDGRLVVEWADDKFADVFGCDVAEFNRRGWLSFIDPLDRAAAERRLAALRAGRSTEAEVRIVDVQGRAKWLRAANAPLVDPESGALLRVIGVGEDVSERRRLAEMLVATVTREQQRIGADLHDGLGQVLTGISLMLRTMSTAAARGAPPDVAALEQLNAHVAEAIATTRSLARGLSPMTLDDRGLLSALRGLARDAQARYGLEIACRLPEDLSLSLDPGAAEHLYRIAQEALTNAARHAGARRAQLRVFDAPPLLELEIVDDGTGFADGFAGDGMGLPMMRHRAAMLGGELLFGGAQPRGTRVTCRIADANRLAARPAD